MMDDLSAPVDTHIYRIKPWLILLNIFLLVTFLVLIGIPLGSLIFAMRTLYRPGTEYGAMALGLLSAFAPLFVLLAMVVLLQSAVTIFTCFSTIKTTPQGIEHRNWPLRHIRARWTELDRLGKFLFSDAVYLQSYEVIGPSLSYRWPWKYLNFTAPSISVSSYTGWPNGPLASDLKRYAPGLFEPRLAEGMATPNLSTATGISQEIRLMAAMAHAAILFLGLGFFVPLVIYATQKQKSACLAFQSLQALIFQVIGSLLGLIFPFCFVGALLVPAIGASVSQSGNAFQLYFGAFLVILAVLVNIIAFGSLAYTIYGIVGAVQVYQGKDFRYAIIGKQLAKRMPPV